jgi:hypothetical protein
LGDWGIGGLGDWGIEGLVFVRMREYDVQEL